MLPIRTEVRFAAPPMRAAIDLEHQGSEGHLETLPRRQLGYGDTPGNNVVNRTNRTGTGQRPSIDSRDSRWVLFPEGEGRLICQAI